MCVQRQSFGVYGFMSLSRSLVNFHHLPFSRVRRHARVHDNILTRFRRDEQMLAHEPRNTFSPAGAKENTPSERDKERKKEENCALGIIHALAGEDSFEIRGICFSAYTFSLVRVLIKIYTTNVRGQVLYMRLRCNRVVL